MARGLGGDDGPSLFMFAACVLIYGKIAGWFEAVKDGVSKEVNTNHASILQAETTAEISGMEAEVKSWPVTWTALPHKQSYYKTIAENMWKEMKSPINIDEAKLIAWCKPLSKNELIAVAKSFGVKEESFPIIGVTAWSGTIFRAMEIAFDGMFKASEYAEMRQIWAKTGLWF